MVAQTARAYVGLGANLGDGAGTLRQVLAELRDTPGIEAVTASPFYRSAPVEATGPDFVNAVAAMDTTLAPLALLDALQALENRHGRQRPYKNAPRTLDLDLLLYGDTRMEHERLTLPHPRMQLRAFVLRPLRDLAPDLALQGRRIDDWIGEIRDQPIERM
ncbi:MAG: 2-amino-4-hydroxy-6-hydroxymethyldihydropteridine diphosphokinase [Achromobacter sp.]|nr:2-amino-4-hydroxy-6-hydroxymethyldihydropteridine diphosphokinase [Achromobacter sp.]